MMILTTTTTTTTIRRSRRKGRPHKIIVLSNGFKIQQQQQQQQQQQRIMRGGGGRLSLLVVLVVLSLFQLLPNVNGWTTTTRSTTRPTTRYSIISTPTTTVINRSGRQSPSSSSSFPSCSSSSFPSSSLSSSSSSSSRKNYNHQFSTYSTTTTCLWSSHNNNGDGNSDSNKSKKNNSNNTNNNNNNKASQRLKSAFQKLDLQKQKELEVTQNLDIILSKLQTTTTPPTTTTTSPTTTTSSSTTASTTTATATDTLRMAFERLGRGQTVDVEVVNAEVDEPSSSAAVTGSGLSSSSSSSSSLPATTASQSPKPTVVDKEENDDDKEDDEDIQTTLQKLEDSFNGVIQFSLPSSSSSLSKSKQEQDEVDENNDSRMMPKQNVHGIYQLQSPEQHSTLLQNYPNKLIIILFSASYCKACQTIRPKFYKLMNDITFNNNKSLLPIVVAEMYSTESTRLFFRRMEILTLPTVHFYDNSKTTTSSSSSSSSAADTITTTTASNNNNINNNGRYGLVENFPCGPKNFINLKQKLAQFIELRIDPITFQLLPEISSTLSRSSSSSSSASSIPTTTTDDGVTNKQVAFGLPPPPRAIRSVLVDNEFVTQEHLQYLRYQLPFFEDVSDDEFHTMLSQTRLLTFDEGDIIIRQGMPGKAFYVIKSGRCEMSIKSRFDDPISTPPNYLGAVVNQLNEFDFFGERALTTREPYAASVRAVEKTRCFAFTEDIIPDSSILSRKRRATREFVDKLTERYELPDDYQPLYTPNQYSLERDQCILELLVRFKQIRQAAKCFDYIMSTEPLWGNQGEIARRSMLVSKLPKSQREDFVEVFNLIDTSKSGTISLLEMRRFMSSAQEEKTDDEILEMLDKTRTAGRSVNYVEASRGLKFGTGLQLNEFLGVMAEAEFYSLFTETFKELDKGNTGYVRAGDLDQVLRGVRDLISDDRKSIIDVVDQDVQVDYEQFAKMLLGAAL